MSAVADSNIPPVPKHSLLILLVAAVDCGMPFWTRDRVVTIWKEAGFSQKFLFPILLEWEEETIEGEGESLARKTLFDGCINSLSKVLTNGLRFNRDQLRDWDCSLRTLGMTFSLEISKEGNHRGKTSSARRGMFMEF